MMCRFSPSELSIMGNDKHAILHESFIRTSVLVWYFNKLSECTNHLNRNKMAWISKNKNSNSERFFWNMKESTEKAKGTAVSEKFNLHFDHNLLTAFIWIDFICLKPLSSLSFSPH